MEILIMIAIFIIFSLAIYGLFFAKHKDVKMTEEVPEFTRSGFVPSHRVASNNDTLDFITAAAVYDIMSSTDETSASSYDSGNSSSDSSSSSDSESFGDN